MMTLTNFSQPELVISIIGVIGTLLGVILGWALSMLSNIGKLYFTRKSVDISGYQLETESLSGKVKVLSGGTLRFYFDVFNSNGRNKYIQNIKLIFKKNKKLTFEKETSIISGKMVTSKITKHDSKYRTIERENTIPIVSTDGGSKVVESKNLITIVGESRLSNEEIFNFDSIYVRYMNQKNKVKTFLLCKRVDIGGLQHLVE